MKVVKLPPGQSAEDAAKRYEASSDIVEYAEPDFLVFPDQTPNDTYYSDGSIWDLNNTGQSSGTNDADIDALEAWGALLVVTRRS